MGKVGIEPTVFTAWVADLQSAAIAAMLTCPNAFRVCKRLPETNEPYCEPQTAGTQNGGRMFAKQTTPFRNAKQGGTDRPPLVSVGRLELPKPWFLAKYVFQIPSHGHKIGRAHV